MISGIRKNFRKRGLWNYPVGLFEIALLADGAKPEEVYPIDVERALKSLDKIKDDVIWWSSGAEPIQLLASGEIPLANALEWRGSESKRGRGTG